MPARRLLCVAVLLLAAAPAALGQITWNFTYADTAGAGNQFGFNDTGTDTATGQTQTRGALRKASLFAAGAYLNTFLDGRGTITARLNTSTNQPTSGTLASFGAGQTTGLSGSFQNGGFYQAARAGQQPFLVDANNNPLYQGSGQFNFGHGWNYVGQVGGNDDAAFDMLTVSIHELVHGLGFASFTNAAVGDGGTPTGRGLTNQPAGSADIFRGYDRFLQRGSGPLATPLLNSTYGAGFGSFVGDPTTFVTPPTDTTNGLFFGGAFTREVAGGPVGLYAPTAYDAGSSVSHVNDTKAVMYYAVAPNTVKRFQPYEIAMLMDIGWNVYNWNGTQGSWLDGVGDVANSRWRTDSGIVYSGAANGNTTYNITSAQGQAPVLPVYGQVTANIALNFTSTATGYTSTNNIGSVRLARLTFSGTAAGTTTVAGGTLNFGLNADNSPSVLKPKIVQNGSGAVAISSAIRTNAIADFSVMNGQTTLATYVGHTGVTVEGTGTGAVTLSGVISGSGGITKNGSFNLTMSGANDYAGTTTVTAGALYFATTGSLSGVGSGVTVSGGTLGGTGTISRAVTVNNTGTLEGGTNSTLGTLGVKGATTVNGGGILRAELGSGTSSDKLDMTGAAHTLDLKNGSFVALSANGFTRATTTYTLADLDATGILEVNDTPVTAGATITTFTFAGVGVDGNSNTIGNIDLTLANFTAISALSNGDKFTLSRSSGGDLVLAFTPVPEPAGVLLVCGLAAAGVVAWRRWKAK